MKRCLDWRVLGGLVAAGAVLWWMWPQAVAAALPVIVVAVCPLSMLVMMWAVRGHDHGWSSDGHDQVAMGQLREQVERLEQERARLAWEVAELRSSFTPGAERGAAEPSRSSAAGPQTADAADDGPGVVGDSQPAGTQHCQGHYQELSGGSGRRRGLVGVDEGV